ncbi:hypothetical protein SpCBS45565_g05092 [Spizellomyces sp. 'palustris']|nr:hypothetical protein SpCBS45565_g05092 [Spizellomyces sp. 'palustris']
MSTSKPDSSESSATPTKKGWNLDAPSYVPDNSALTQTPATDPRRGHHGGGLNGRGRGRGQRGRGNFRGRSAYKGGSGYGYEYPWLPRVYYGEEGYVHYGSPDPRTYHTDAVLLAGGETGYGGDGGVGYTEGYPYIKPAPDNVSLPSYQSQDFADLSVSSDTERDNETDKAESLADSVITSSTYTDATSTSFVESLITQSSRGSGYRNLNQQHRLGGQASLRQQASMNSEERRLEQRQKQIDYGKNTVGYKRYIAMVPKHKRKRGDPETPKKHAKCSKRCWDGLIRHWRRKLHEWDPPEMKEQGLSDLEFSDIIKESVRTTTDQLEENLKHPTELADWTFPPVTKEPLRVKPTPLGESLKQPQAARNLGFGSTPTPTEPLRPLWAQFSIDELDQKFASKLRPWETFEGFGPSPTRRTTKRGDDPLSWAEFSIDELDEKFGHKLRISEAIDLTYSPLNNSASSPFTPSPRSKLAPIGRPTPVKRLNPMAASFDGLGASPISSDTHHSGESSVTPRKHRSNSIGLSYSDPRRLHNHQMEGSASPLSLYEEEDSVMVIYDPAASSSVPSLTSSTLPSRAASPSRTVMGREATPQSLWGNGSPNKGSPGIGRVGAGVGEVGGGTLLDGVW